MSTGRWAVRTGEAAALDVGTRVRAARLRHGLSLRALSRDLNISPGTMSQVETGKAGLSVARLHQIATALGMTADELLTLTPAVEPAPAPPGVERAEAAR